MLANGILTTPKLARIEGMETFEGESFHTSRWDYHVDLKGKRVGIIGTGATAVQVIPEIAKIVKELYVFQRTPSTIDVRDQRATTPGGDRDLVEGAGLGAGAARTARHDLVRAAPRCRPMTIISPARSPISRQRRQYERELSPEELIEKQLNTNFRIMEQIRARVDAIVKDPKTAAALKPYYPYGCKRPTFHDEYPADLQPAACDAGRYRAASASARSTQRGVVHDGKEYPLDVLIYATGFHWMATSTFNMITGRDGKRCSEKWKAEGVKTFLGLHSHGFPEPVHHVGPARRRRPVQLHPRHRGAHRLRRLDAEDLARSAAPASSTSSGTRRSNTPQHCREADIRTPPLRDCLSYYNGDGTAEPGSLAYYGGPQEWHGLRSAAQDSLEPYVFDAKPEQRPVRPAGGAVTARL